MRILGSLSLYSYYSIVINSLLSLSLLIALA